MQRISGYAQQGNVTVTVAGVSSSNVFQGSYPGCTVSIFNQGTLVLATIYSDNGVTLKSNPFLSSSTDGSWFFYAAGGRYDIQFSGVGITTPFTIGDVLLFDIANITTNLTMQQPTAATALANQSSFSFCEQGTYWTGAASATDQWCWQDVLGAGANPTSTYTLTHSGSSGVAAISLPAAIASLNVKAFEAVQFVDAANSQGWAGSDPGAWINAAAAALPATGGLVDACGLNVASPPTATTAITIPAKVRLRVCGLLTTSNASATPILLADGGSGIEGQGANTAGGNGVLCTGLSAGNGCITVGGSTTTHRHFVIRDLVIQTNTAGNGINLQDGTGDISIERVEIKSAGEGIHLIAGAQGGLLLHIMQVRVDAPAGFGFNLDASLGTAWALIKIENSYVTAVTGGSVGMNFANVDAAIIASSVDNCTIGWQLGGTIRVFGGHSESNTTAVSIVGAGDYLIDGFLGIGNTQLIAVNAANANTTIVNPRSTNTGGGNDITYSAISTGQHHLIGGALLSKPVSVTSPAVLYRIQGNSIQTLNGSTTFTNSSAAPAVIISGSGNANNQGLSIIDTDASGHRWDVSEAFAVGSLSFRDRTQTGGPAWSLKVTGTTANQGILAHANTGDRTYTFPDATGNVVLSPNAGPILSATSTAFATATTAGTCVQNVTAVTGATTAMAVAVSPVSTPGVGAVYSGFVSSPGNVTITECAVAASAGGTIAFNIRVIP